MMPCYTCSYTHPPPVRASASHQCSPAPGGVMRHFGPYSAAASTGTPQTTFKRTLLQIILPLAILALAISWRIDATVGSLLPFDSVAYPLLIALYTGSAILL